MDVKLVSTTCCKCGMDVWLTKAFDAWLRADSRRGFYCPKGHSLHYADEDNDIEAMRRERNRLRQQAARRDDEIKQEREMRLSAERSAAAQRGQVTKIKKRVVNGICPCCNRSFQNLHRHMKSQHPDYGEKI